MQADATENWVDIKNIEKRIFPEMICSRLKAKSQNLSFFFLVSRDVKF